MLDPFRTVVHLIEPQDLFVPALIDVFAEAGLSVDAVGPSVDPRRLLDDKPDLIFFDTDFLDRPLEDVRLAHMLVPDAAIYVYASARTDAMVRSFTAAGATTVVQKSADRRTIVANLRAFDQRHRGDRSQN
jgi:DNA-binding NarL/FixJ family response regulator